MAEVLQLIRRARTTQSDRARESVHQSVEERFGSAAMSTAPWSHLTTPSCPPPSRQSCKRSRFCRQPATPHSLEQLLVSSAVRPVQSHGGAQRRPPSTGPRRHGETVPTGPERATSSHPPGGTRSQNVCM